MASVPADGYAACWHRGRGGALTGAWGSPKCRCPRTSEVRAEMRTCPRRCSHVRADRGRACQRGKGRRHVRILCRWDSGVQVRTVAGAVRRGELGSAERFRGDGGCDRRDVFVVIGGGAVVGVVVDGDGGLREFARGWVRWILFRVS